MYCPENIKFSGQYYYTRKHQVIKIQTLVGIFFLYAGSVSVASDIDYQRYLHIISLVPIKKKYDELEYERYLSAISLSSSSRVIKFPQDSNFHLTGDDPLSDKITKASNFNQRNLYTYCKEMHSVFERAVLSFAPGIDKKSLKTNFEGTYFACKQVRNDLES